MAIMKKRRAKFPLILENDNEANTMEELQEYFDLEKIIGYFHDGKLITWLDDRLYADEADEVRKLTGKEEDLGDRLCRIFHFENLEDDPETIAWRNERIERLKKYTLDSAIINNVDSVAFDQDDLEDIVINGDTNAIYLCDNEFSFPSGILRKKNIRYIGLGDSVKVVVKSKETADLSALGIVFENVKVEGNYKKSEKIVEPSIVYPPKSENTVESSIVYPSSSYNDEEDEYEYDDEDEEDYDYWPEDEISLKVRELITKCMFVDEEDFEIDDIVYNIGFGDDNQHIKYVANLILTLEDAYHIEIDDKTATDLSIGTVDNLISYLKESIGYYDALANVNLLIVDDAAFMRMVIKDILTNYNCNIVGEAENGIKAIEKYQSLCPDIVIMDLTMPEMDGIEAIRRIKAIDPDAKIIAVSNIGQQELVIEAIQSGARDFIVKPFQESRVIETVRKHINNNSGYYGYVDDDEDDEVFIKVREIIEEQLGLDEDEIKMRSEVINDLGADSLDVVELIMAVEEEFNIEIPDEAAMQMKTVGDVLNYIKSNL